MEENYIYVKQKKYIWNIKEVRFIEVLLEQDGVKIKNEKIKRILN